MPLLLAALLSAAPVHRVAVLDVGAAGVPDSTAATVGLLLPTAVREALPDASVISGEEIRTMLGFEKQKALMGCKQDTACMTEIGGALGVDELVTGKLGKLGPTFVLELRRVDVRKVQARSVTRTADREADLVGVTRAAVVALFPEGALKPEAPAAAVERPSGAEGGARRWAWAPGAAGVVALGVGGVFLYRASSAHSALVANSPPAGGATPAQLRDTESTGQTVGWTGVGVGAAALATAAAMFFSGGSGSGAGLSLVPGGAAVTFAGALP